MSLVDMTSLKLQYIKTHFSPLRDNRRDLATVDLFGCCKSSNLSSLRFCGRKTLQNNNELRDFSIEDCF